MNRLISILFMLSAAMCLSAQDSAPAPGAFQFGYLSYDEVLRSMPDYQTVQDSLATVRRQYETELRRAEQEFNKKYEEFLDGRKDFPTSILHKRQTELQELMQRNVDFRAQSLTELSQAETRAMQPLLQKLSQAIALVGRQQGLALILNTDQNACPYINPAAGINVTQAVKNALR